MSSQAAQDLDFNVVLSTVLIMPIDQHTGQPLNANKETPPNATASKSGINPGSRNTQTAKPRVPNPTAPRTMCSRMDLLANKFWTAMIIPPLRDTLSGHCLTFDAHQPKICLKFEMAFWIFSQQCVFAAMWQRRKNMA
jgi:hypothetical protein